MPEQDRRKTILDADGNPLPPRITVRERLKNISTKVRILVITGAAVIAGVATLISNLSYIRGFFVTEGTSAKSSTSIGPVGRTERTHIYLEDRDGHPILGDFQAVIRAPNGQQSVPGDKGTVSVELPAGRSKVYVYVTMEDYAMRDRPPLPIDDKTVTIVMVDRAIPTSVPPELALSPPTEPAPVVSSPPADDLPFRIKFLNDLNSTFRIYVWSQGAEKYQQIVLPPNTLQVLELPSNRDARYRLSLQSSEGIQYDIGWVDLGKFNEDFRIKLSDMLL